MLYRYEILHTSTTTHNLDGCPTCGTNHDDIVKQQQQTIKELNEKLQQKEVIQAPLPALPEDSNLLVGNDDSVKSNVLKSDNGKDLITQWSDYNQLYKDFVSNNIESQYLPENFIIAIVTANRPQYLGATLRSLQQVLYWNRNNTIIYQYGDDKRINIIANEYNIRQVKNPVLQAYQGKQITEGAEHIAIHYKFVIDHVFQSNPSAKYFIIVEDDMLFAPDVLLYFAQLAPLMDRDHTIYSISAYNDNGFKGRSKYDNMVYRTDFFIGLGWLVSRRLWEAEWSRSWPRTHWDHFLRNPMNRRNRQTLYPEVSRIYHSGYKGTHSTVALYEKYFRDIKLNLKGYAPLGIAKADYMSKPKPKYRFTDIDKQRDETTVDYLEAENFKQFFATLINPSDEQVVYLSTIEGISKYKNKRIVIPYEAQLLINRAWIHISEYFDVWHTVPVRSEYMGVTPFHWMNDNTIFMMATYSHYYEQFETYFKKSKPALVPVEDFQVEPPWILPKSKSVLSISTAEQGQSCSTLCQTKFGESSKCDLFKISELNTCRNLKKFFDCNECGGNIGHDQPALDVEEKKCLFNTGSRQYMTTCEGSHPKTQRLCACFDPSTVVTFHEEWETMIAAAQKQATNPDLE
jgi:hypothetical protein